MFGRLLKLRYILLTGVVGGGITAHQVTNRLISFHFITVVVQFTTLSVVQNGSEQLSF